jgi:hypothetical protein
LIAIPKNPTIHIQKTAPGLEMVDRARVVRVVVPATQHVRAVGQGTVLAESAPEREDDAGAQKKP